MQIQIDVQGMLQESLAKALSPDVLKPVLEKALNDTLERAIKDAFGYNSDFRKLMETSVAEAMPKEIDGLVVMGELITDRIKQVVGAQQEAALAQIIDAQLSELMAPAPAQMKLSDLCREMTKRWGGRDFDRPEGSKPTIIKETSSYGGVSLYLDKDDGKEKYETEFELHLSSDSKAILSIRVRGEERKPPSMFISHRWNDELYFTRLFAAGTQFDIDMADGESFSHYYWED